MARSERLFKRSFNSSLDLILAGADLRNISVLARELSVSRTTARRILKRLATLGVIAGEATDSAIIRRPEAADYFPPSETLSIEETLESAFMSMVGRHELVPGARLNESYLARQLDVSAPTIREFLIGLSRFGFVRKDAKRCWILEGFTKKYALELHEVRVLFECRAISKVCHIDDNDPFWGGVIRLRDEHLAIDETTDFDEVDFPALDTRFHRFFNAQADNRLFVGFQDAISLIFNYHFLWDVAEPGIRNIAARNEHLAIIDAILARNEAKAVEAMRAHLATTHRKFLDAICSQNLTEPAL